MLKAKISEEDCLIGVEPYWEYTIYTSAQCKGLDYRGSYKSLAECKRAIKRMGVKLGQTIEVIE